MTRQWYYAHEGQQIGPMTFQELQVLAASGRLSPHDLVWSEGMSNWVPARNIADLFSTTKDVAPPTLPTGHVASYQARVRDQPLGLESSLQPHRGALILTLGILGLLVCAPFGIAAWIMGANDLRDMKAGRMDSSGRGMTQAGYILGIIATVFFFISVFMIMLIFIARAGAG